MNSKWIKDIYIRAKTIKVFEENIEFGIDFLAMTSKTQVAKDKLDKLDFMKMNTFYAPKGEKTTYGMGKIFAYHRPHKGLILRIYKELQNSIQLNSKMSRKFK